MAIPRSLRVTPTSTLTHSFDLEERIQNATAADTLKGMFFQRLIEIGEGTTFEAELRALDAPPRRLRYQAFFDYPVADYFRLVVALSRALHPGVVASEAVRRTAGHDFAHFAKSRIGRVMLAFGGNARSALAHSGAMYGAVLKGSAKVTSEATSEGVRVSYRNYPGLTEVYPIGTIEGCCRHFDVGYEIDINVLSERDADYLIRLDD